MHINKQQTNKQNNAIYLANKHNEATRVFILFSTTVTIKAIQFNGAPKKHDLYKSCQR